MFFIHSRRPDFNRTAAPKDKSYKSETNNAVHSNKKSVRGSKRNISEDAAGAGAAAAAVKAVTTQAYSRDSSTSNRIAPYCLRMNWECFSAALRVSPTVVSTPTFNKRSTWMCYHGPYQTDSQEEHRGQGSA